MIRSAAAAAAGLTRSRSGGRQSVWAGVLDGGGGCGDGGGGLGGGTSVREMLTMHLPLCT